MEPKNKNRALLLGLIVPYGALVMYFARRVPEHPLPSWFPYFGLSYILASLLLVTTVVPKIFRRTQTQTVQTVRPAAQRLALRTWAGYLIAVWTGGLLWGGYLTVTGQVAWQRALPAGAFLLAFIALFSRLLYKDVKGPSDPAPIEDAKASR